MSGSAYSVWVLVIQLSAYVGLLDFGIQTAVGRFVAHATELKDEEQRDQFVNSSIAILSAINFPILVRE